MRGLGDGTKTGIDTKDISEPEKKNEGEKEECCATEENKLTMKYNSEKDKTKKILMLKP